MPRKTYTDEFRAHLVALVLEGRTPEGTRVSRMRVARLMREAGICGVTRRKG